MENATLNDIQMPNDLHADMLGQNHIILLYFVWSLYTQTVQRQFIIITLTPPYELHVDSTYKSIQLNLTEVAQQLIDFSRLVRIIHPGCFLPDSNFI